MRTWLRRPELYLFLVTWLAYSVCLPEPSFDTFWTVPVALSMLRHGVTHVDEFIAQAPQDAHYGVVCVPPQGAALGWEQANGCAGGHWYSFYPVETSLLALPVVAAVQLLTKLTAGFTVPVVATHGSHPVLAAFLSGDLVAGHALVELWCAALLSALSAPVAYRLFRICVNCRTALLLTFVYCFGSSMWSVASRALWQHGPAALFLSLLLLCLVEKRFGWAGFWLALSYAARPSIAVVVLLLCCYMAIHQRAGLTRFLLGAAPVAIVFLAYNLISLHTLLPLYFFAPGSQLPAGGRLQNLAAQLISPSRGVFVFTPMFLLSVYGAVLAVRRRWLFPLTPYLLAILAVHTALVANWWPGHCYGSRYFTEMTIFFVFFVVPATMEWNEWAPERRRLAAALFFALAGWGFLVHGHGATSTAANLWSIMPVNVNEAPQRVWDWSDPQWLRR